MMNVRAGSRLVKAAAAIFLAALTVFVVLLYPGRPTNIVLVLLLSGTVALGVDALLRQRRVSRRQVLVDRRFVLVDQRLAEAAGQLTSVSNAIAAVRRATEDLVREVADLHDLESARHDSAVGAVKDVSAAVMQERGIRQKRHWELVHVVRDQTRDVEALIQLYGKIMPRVPMPSSGRWAMDAAALLQVVSLVEEQRPGLVVELGSGTSSVWIGHALANADHGRLISLEHDDHYAARTEATLAAHGLSEIVTVRRAPLSPLEVAGATYSWYNEASLKDLEDIDLLLVDGPPTSSSPQARYPAAPLLCNRLADGALVVLDDVGREDEKEIARRWAEEVDGLWRCPELLGKVAIFRWSGDQECDRSISPRA